ncbi:MAG: bifunctional riboflavin kinase/FAD synthetase [Lachnospiraceae bacterium]
MEYIKGIESYQGTKPTAITLGKFDGIHVGHQKLVNCVKDHGMKDHVKSVVFAFDMGPLYQRLQMKKEGLMTNRERYLYLDGQVDYLVECRFTEDISSMKAEDFIKHIIVGTFHARYVVVGTDFYFGNGKQGDYHMLEQYAGTYGYQVEVIEKECYQGREISSTYIKEEVKKGNMELAHTLLGYPYAVMGRVEHGRRLGRTLGIPTMNVTPKEEKLLPPHGVYAIKVSVDHVWYEGIGNVGVKPTVVDSPYQKQRIECHLFDYHEETYGKEILIALYAYERAEQKFSSVEELQAHMKKDIAYGKQYFTKEG